MAYAVNDARNQVLLRVNEAANSPIAELESGTGPANAPAISTIDAIVGFLNEAQNLLARSGGLPIYGSGTITPAAGTARVRLAALTPDTAGRVLWQVRSGRYGTAPLTVCDRQWYEVHSNGGAGATGNPKRVYQDGEEAVLLDPRPSSSAIVLTLEGAFLPRPAVTGQNFLDVPDQLVPGLIAYACSMIAKKLAGEPGLAAALPIWETEWRAAFGIPLEKARR